MIGKAKSISHGINDIKYISGESRHKEHPELIYHVKDNLLPCGLDAQGVWDMMKAHAPTGNNVIRIEISPAKEHTKDFTMEDWQRLWDDFVREFDNIEMTDDDGKVYSHKTNIAGSIYTAWLHLESDSRIPHLHAAVCRKDCNGRTNNDHKIHIRAHDAAQEVAVKRGWTTAMDIHKANADRVAEELTDILLAMPSWSWDDYVARVLARGYTLVTRPDSKGGIKGYVVGKGRARFKASELGRGRKLMASRIEQTWQKLHAKAETKPVQPVGKTGARTVAPVVPVVAQPVTLSDKPVADYSAWREGTSRYELTQGSNDYRFYIPDDVMQVFNDEFDYRETVNHKELTDMAWPCSWDLPHLTPFQPAEEAEVQAMMTTGVTKKTRTRLSAHAGAHGQRRRIMGREPNQDAEDKGHTYGKQEIRLQRRSAPTRRGRKDTGGDSGGSTAAET